MKKFLVIAAAVIAVMALATPAEAKGRYNATIDLAPGSVLVYEGTVDFVWSSDYTSDTGMGPWLRLECYEPPLKGKKLGPLVYFQNRAGFEGGYLYGESFDLGPSLAWQGQPVVCVGSVAHLEAKRGVWVQDATVEFEVN